MGISDWDIPADKVFFDRQSLSLYGLTNETFFGTIEEWQKVIHPDDVLRVGEEIRKALSGEKAFSTIFRVLWPDNTVHYISAHGLVKHNEANEAVRMVGVNWDITEDYLAKEKLAFLASIVESSEDSIVTKTLTGVITSWNKGAENLFGYSASEAVGKNISLIVPFEKNDVMHIIDTMKQGKKLEHYVTVRKRKDNAHIDVILTASPVYNREGMIIGISVISRDYSREKQIQQMKSDFVSMVSHQLKTPMAQVMGFVDNMIDGLTGPITEKQREYLTDIRQVATDNAILIDDLLNVSRLDRGILDVRVESHDARSIVSAALKPLSSFAIEHEVTVAYENPIEGEFLVKVDVSKAIETVRNIVHNAIKFTKRGTEVSVLVSDLGQAVTVSVVDRGDGIKKEAEGLIFSRERYWEGACRHQVQG